MFQGFATRLTFRVLKTTISHVIFCPPDLLHLLLFAFTQYNPHKRSDSEHSEIDAVKDISMQDQMPTAINFRRPRVHEAFRSLEVL
jgi:hypothetical protein